MWVCVHNRCFVVKMAKYRLFWSLRNTFSLRRVKISYLFLDSGDLEENSKHTYMSKNIAFQKRKLKSEVRFSMESYRRNHIRRNFCVI